MNTIPLPQLTHEVAALATILNRLPVVPKAGLKLRLKKRRCHRPTATPNPLGGLRKTRKTRKAGFFLTGVPVSKRL